MADVDLDAVIRQLAKQQNKIILAAAKKRRDRFNGMAVKAKDVDAKDRYKMLAREVLEQAGAAARRLLLSADNAADSYARAMRQAAAAELPKRTNKKTDSKTEKNSAKSAEKATDAPSGKPAKAKAAKAPAHPKPKKLVKSAKS
ncbi:MAG TPA: hypothetical protein VFR21_29435 [Bradyrhizobium sp.]|jgi:hypothetical protein|nr:hypothetical protein [Bradyrhizobium sp.]